MRDLEAIRVLILTVPLSSPERLAVLFFIIAEATDLAYELEILRAQQPRPKPWQVYRWN